MASFFTSSMDGSNGTEGEENLSPTLPNSGEKVAILDAGAQYGKVIVFNIVSAESNLSFFLR